MDVDQTNQADHPHERPSSPTPSETGQVSIASGEYQSSSFEENEINTSFERKPEKRISDSELSRIIESEKIQLFKDIYDGIVCRISEISEQD